MIKFVALDSIVDMSVLNAKDYKVYTDPGWSDHCLTLELLILEYILFLGFKKVHPF